MHVAKLFNERLRGSLSEGGIHFGPARILAALRQRDKLTQGAIGRGLHIKPATVTNLVKKMEASGLIARRQDPDDDRIMNVSLTSKGRAAADFAASVMEEIEDDIHWQLTRKEIHYLSPAGLL